MNGRMWIRDRDETPQGFPLKELLRGVRSLFAREQFKVEIYRAEGYGLQINTWRTALEREDHIVVDFFALDALTKGTAEWLYSLDARFISTSMTVGLGLHDSSALYEEATNNAPNQLKALFNDITYEKVRE